MAAKLVCGLLAVLLLASSGLAQKTDAEKAATRDYVVAQGFQKKRLYANAVTHWKTFLTAHPKSVRVPAVLPSVSSSLPLPFPTVEPHQQTL